MQFTLKPNPLNVNFFLDALIFFQDSKMELVSGKRMDLALIHEPLRDEARRQGGPITKATPYSQEWAGVQPNHVKRLSQQFEEERKDDRGNFYE